jgi:hypothetical protein
MFQWNKTVSFLLAGSCVNATTRDANKLDGGGFYLLPAVVLRTFRCGTALRDNQIKNV